MDMLKNSRGGGSLTGPPPFHGLCHQESHHVLRVKIIEKSFILLAGREEEQQPTAVCSP